MEFRRPCVLDPSRHGRETFRCSDTSLDEWLQKFAGQNRRGNTAATWVIADAEYQVLAYATLTMTSVDRSACPRPLAKGAPAAVPALLVGRLATDHRVAGLGLGTAMVRHILATALELNLKAACRAVVVTALDVRAFTWWQKFGFAPMDPRDDQNLDLYLLTKDIQASLYVDGRIIGQSRAPRQ